MARSRRLTATVLALLLGVGALAAAPSTDSGAEAGWYRIDYAQRISDADRAQLAEVGVEAVQYVPTDAYVAWLAHDLVDTVASDAHVEAVTALTATDKLDPALTRSHGAVVALVATAAVDDATTNLSDLASIAAVHPADTRGELHEVVLDAPVDALAIASRPEVLHVGPAPTGLHPEDEQATQIVAGNLNATNTPDIGYEAWLDELGLDGSGVRVSVVDTGVSDDHPDLEGRVVAKVDYSLLATGEPADTGGHGTHVAGIIGGNATGLSGSGLSRGTDASGFLYGLGVAPAVELVDQNGIATTYRSWPPPGGWAVLTRDAVDNGSHIWNASWTSGEGVGVGYNASSRTMDTLARDAHDGQDGNQPFTLVFSAGNSGAGQHDADTRLTAPKEAKNIIAVAASNNSRAGNVEQIASFSSRGPTRDGRIVPHVSAPGATVYSTRTMRGVPGFSSCGQPLVDDDGLLYSSCSGTSMAAPHVTGAVALITQWWRGSNADADPSPAMSKALLVNSAVDMGAPDVPNRHEGWGRIHLGNLFDPSVQRSYLDQQLVFGEVDEATTESVVVGAGAALRVTLAWTDAPGLAGTVEESALVNDLDLVVIGPDGTRWHGNVFADGVSVGGGEADRLNNLENVFLAAPVAGTYQVVVSAANLPGDGIPGNEDLTDQDFALVTSVDPAG